MRKKLLTILVILALLAGLVTSMAAPALAGVNSLVMTLAVLPDVTYNNQTVQYTVILTNQNLPGAVPVLFDLYFRQPGADGNPGAEVLLQAGLLYAVGESHTYTSVDYAVLGATLNLNPGVTVAYGRARFHGAYQATPPYDADDSRNIPVQIIWPSSTVTISSTPPGPVPQGSTVTLTVTETNNTGGPTEANLPGGTDLTSPQVVLTSTAGLNLTLNKASGPSGDAGIIGTLDGDNDGTAPFVGETWTWSVPGVVVNANTTFTAVGDGIDYLLNHVTYPPMSSEQAQVTVNVYSPHTTVTITSSASLVPVGGTVTLTVREINDGSGAAPLINPYVDLTKSPAGAPFPLTLNRGSPYWFGGDGGTPNVLDVGETWTWSVPGVVVNANTTYTATGHGTDPGGIDITWPALASERAQVTVNVFTGATMVTITATPTVVLQGETVTLTVTEQNTGTAPLTNPRVDLTSSPAGPPLPLSLIKGPPYWVGGDTDNDGVLDGSVPGPAETWTWSIPGVVVNDTTTYIATGHGTDPGGNDITYPAYSSERAQVQVQVPHTTAAMAASVTEVPPGGGNVTLTISDTNDGDVPLINPYVSLTSSPALPPLPLSLVKGDIYWIGGDTDNDGVLDGTVPGPAETWTWRVTVWVSQDTTFVATGHGTTDPGGIDITYPAYPTEQVEVRVNVRRDVPVSSNVGTGLMIGGFAIAMVFFILRRSWRYQHQQQ